MEIFYKNMLVWLTIPIFAAIPAPINMCSSGVIENNLDAIYEVINDTTLLLLFIMGITTFVLAQLMALVIIKYSNAMTKVMIVLLKTFLLWIFFMAWPGYGHEDWNFIKAAGMLMLSVGTIYYIKLDI